VVVTEPGVVESLLNAQQFEVSERWGRPAKIKMRLALLVSRNGISGRRKYSTAICSDLRSAWASMSQGRRPTVDECGGANSICSSTTRRKRFLRGHFRRGSTCKRAARPSSDEIQTVSRAEITRHFRSNAPSAVASWAYAVRRQMRQASSTSISREVL